MLRFHSIQKLNMFSERTKELKNEANFMDKSDSDTHPLHEHTFMHPIAQYDGVR